MAGICMMLLVMVVHVQDVFGKPGTGLSESDLHLSLFSDYLQNVKPHVDKSTPLEVTINMYLMSLDNINEKRQTITLRAFLELKWKDEFLVWDKEEYSNISLINVKDSSIWLPDIALMNTFDKPTDLGYGSNAVIASDGLVTIWPYKMFTVSCKIGIAQFPFDKQECKFDLGSWTSNNDIISLNNVSDKIPLSHLIESGEWDLIDTRVEKTASDYDGVAYDHVIFIVQFKRKSLFHVMNLIIPVLCISLLNVTSFLLPSEDGERVTLSISVFLTLAVFLTVVNSSMPETSDEVAVFTIYVGMQLFGSVLNVLVTVVSLSVFHIDKENEVPRQLKYFVRMCGVRKKKIDQTEDNAEPPVNSPTKPVPTMKDIFTHRIKVANELHRVTWKMVSRAIDKFCAVFAVIWNVLLFTIMMVSMTM